MDKMNDVGLDVNAQLNGFSMKTPTTTGYTPVGFVNWNYILVNL